MANGRKVVVTGRSMVQNTDIARKLGYLKISDQDIIDAYDLKGIPPEQVVIMCTGSQGEPLSALARIAAGEHKTIDMDGRHRHHLGNAGSRQRKGRHEGGQLVRRRSAPTYTTSLAPACMCPVMHRQRN